MKSGATRHALMNIICICFKSEFLVSVFRRLCCETSVSQTRPDETETPIVLPSKMSASTQGPARSLSNVARRTNEAIYETTAETEIFRVI